LVYRYLPFWWRAPAIPVFRFWFQSQYPVTYIHSVILDCSVFSTLLVQILVRKFSLKSFFPRSS
jgi:hypothetical protein